MKKFIAIFVAVLTLGLAAQATAYFEEGHLIRVVYDKNGGGVEVATDLGEMRTWTTPGVSPSNVIVGDGESAWDLSMFPGRSLNDLVVEYYAIVYGTYDAWTSGPFTGQISGNRKFTGFNSAAGITRVYYNTLVPTGSRVVGAESHLQSHYTMFGKVGLSIGGFNDFIYPQYNGEENLGVLSTQGYVDQVLYFYNVPNSVGTGVPVAILRTMADGSTIINPGQPVVPVPASILLLGSGLLGLIGVRRKNS
ncbi:MAG: VPLPA-CTERM sorting domain-containing protein [Deltaproteobacteria bacterium]|nr:VPLPA-CTERM sorting domain-containing protein [Deltaproteobacteria bacterium]